MARWHTLGFGGSAEKNRVQGSTFGLQRRSDLIWDPYLAPVDSNVCNVTAGLGAGCLGCLSVGVPLASMPPLHAWEATIKSVKCAGCGAERMQRSVCLTASLQRMLIGADFSPPFLMIIHTYIKRNHIHHSHLNIAYFFPNRCRPCMLRCRSLDRSAVPRRPPSI